MNIINNSEILKILTNPSNIDSNRIHEILNHAKQMKGLSLEEVHSLLNITDDKLLDDLFQTASFVKNEIYGKRLVLFSPLYISNLCNNECLYCAFRNKNHSLKRKSLTQDEISEETRSLILQGHKRILLVAGESYGSKGLDYVLDSIKTIYSVKENNSNIRRINVNIAPLTVNEFKKLNEHKIGTYQLFQETYHRETYQKLHLSGPKSDYQNRLETMDHAFQAGIKDVGIGLLFGLYDWKYEILALLSHASYLEKEYGIGPHTISIPRLEKANGSDISYNPPFPVSNLDFKKIVAILRLAVPYTGIILSTRENPQMRKDALNLGVSQISAGSKTNPGGHQAKCTNSEQEEQFALGDSRSLLEVIKDVVNAGFIPSFCTGCYRMGRVGADFMDLAKPGLIKRHCLPNALFTFREYLNDFADDELKISGNNLINQLISNEVSKDQTKSIKENMASIDLGKRDIYY